MVRFGRIYIYIWVSMLSSPLTLPRGGYFDQVIRIFYYPKKYYNFEMVFDPNYLVIGESLFEIKD